MGLDGEFRGGEREREHNVYGEVLEDKLRNLDFLRENIAIIGHYPSPVISFFFVHYHHNHTNKINLNKKS